MNERSVSDYLDAATKAKNKPVSAYLNETAKEQDKPVSKQLSKRTREKNVIDKSLAEKFGEGLKKSSFGKVAQTLTGGIDNELNKVPLNESFLQGLASDAGEWLGDFPAMATGAALGGLAGAGVASVPAGGAGMFAAPTFIKEVMDEFQTVRDAGEEYTFGNFLSAVERTAKSTGKSGIVGAATGSVGKVLPFLSKVPGIDKILKSKTAQKAVETGLELGTMVGGSAALEGELPTAKDIAKGAILVGGMKAVHAIPKAIKFGEKAKVTMPEIKEVTRRLKDFGKDVVGKIKSKMFESEIGEHAQEMVKQRVWRENARNEATRIDINSSIRDLEKRVKLTPKMERDAVLYKERTGDPLIKGDTFADLEKRVPQPVKYFMDKRWSDFFAKYKKEFNETKGVKKIMPRKDVEAMFTPHRFEHGDKFRATPDTKSNLGRSLSMKRGYKTLHEAVTEGGFIPQDRSLKGSMYDYAKRINKAISSAELAEKISVQETIKSLSDAPFKDRMIVTSNEGKKMAQKAQDANWVRFDAKEIRRSRLIRDGKLVSQMATEAWVHPDAAVWLKNVVNELPPQSRSAFFRIYDKVTNMARSTKLAGSLFHHAVLQMGATAHLGPRATLRPIKTFKLAKDKYNSPLAYKYALKGLKLGSNMGDYKSKASLANKAIDIITKSSLVPYGTEVKAGLMKIGEKYQKAEGFLMEEWRPAMKVEVCDNLVQNEIKKAAKKGRELTPIELDAVERAAAEETNNTFGGQNWETIKYLGNPKNRKLMQRIMFFPDWNTSIPRQIVKTLAPGLRGEMARKYWFKYGLIAMALNKGLHLLSSGGDVGDVWKEVTEGRLFSFPLPDKEISIAGMKFNLGRNSEGRRLRADLGKALFEVVHWGTDPIETLFNKLTPQLNACYKLMQDPRTGRPSIKGFVDPKRLGKEAVGMVAPFSASAAYQHGVAPYLTAGLGTATISQELPKRKASELIYKALVKGKVYDVNAIRRKLRKSNYKPSEIDRMVSSARARIKREKKEANK